MVRKIKKPKTEKPIKLSLAYPDLSTLLEFPWAWTDNSVEEFLCTDVMHYVPGKLRPRFMDELYRILIPGGKATIIVAYYSTSLAFADYNLEWPPLCEQSFLYFNKGWRDANKLPYPVKCDFDFTYGYILVPEVATRSTEVQTFQVKSYLNTVQRLQVILTKRTSEVTVQ